MPTNDFLPFATAVGANVLDQVDYAALAAVSTGYTAGTAASQQLNKTWRQASIIGAMVAQFIVDQTGQNAVDDGTIATLEANLGKAVTGRLINIRAFASPGASTYTPTAGTASIVVEVQGGGGGGGGAALTTGGFASTGAGGGGGGFAMSRLATGFSGATITIGAAGSAGGAGGSGGAGGTSSFGALLTATGGGGGGAGGTGAFPATNTSAGASGVGASGNVFNGNGGAGGISVLASTTSCVSCGGGDSHYGDGGAPVFTTGAGTAAVNAGAGGSGGLSVNGAAAQAGGAGAHGLVIIYEYA